ncbi:uncharacterized protein [Onthophagus taurus]|uniref:uncharacterized protein n=1 Tax=Onthophagus taurus TaxID=166361 RepID=UPI0039BDCC83
MTSHLFKVWDFRRENRVIVLIKDEHDVYTQLILKASMKLEINGEMLVLEKDGSRVDDDEILLLLKDEIFILLEKGDKWKNPNDETDSLPTTISRSSGFNDDELTGTFHLEDSTPLVLSPLAQSTLNKDNILTISLDNNNYNDSQKGSDTKDIDNTTNCAITTSWPASQTTRNQVSYETWNALDIPWDKMRTLATHISIGVFKIIAAKVIAKYPFIFKDTDRNNVTIGTGDHGLVSKLIDRNNYLNRQHKRSITPTTKMPKSKIRKLMNIRSGCARNWNPEALNVSTDVKHYLQNAQEMDDRFWGKMEESFAEQRSFINNFENPSIQVIKTEWPVLLKKEVIFWHFEKITGCNLSDVKNNLTEKVQDILNIKTKNNKLGDIHDQLLSSLQLVATHFKEHLTFFVDVVDQNETSRKTASPCIIKSGTDENQYFGVYLENELILQEVNLTEAFFFNFLYALCL